MRGLVAQESEARRRRMPESCASVCPPRLDPPVPKNTIVGRARRQVRFGGRDRRVEIVAPLRQAAAAGARRRHAAPATSPARLRCVRALGRALRRRYVAARYACASAASIDWKGHRCLRLSVSATQALVPHEARETRRFDDRRRSIRPRRLAGTAIGCQTGRLMPHASLWRPTMVTRMSAVSSRLATRLASSSVTASINPLRRSM